MQVEDIRNSPKISLLLFLNLPRIVMFNLGSPQNLIYQEAQEENQAIFLIIVISHRQKNVIPQKFLKNKYQFNQKKIHLENLIII